MLSALCHRTIWFDAIYECISSRRDSHVSLGAATPAEKILKAFYSIISRIACKRRSTSSASSMRPSKRITSAIRLSISTMNSKSLPSSSAQITYHPKRTVYTPLSVSRNTLSISLSNNQTHSPLSILNNVLFVDSTSYLTSSLALTAYQQKYCK